MTNSEVEKYDLSTEEKAGEALVLIIDSTCRWAKLSLLQCIPLFLMPYILGFNRGIVALIGLYTMLFGIYFIVARKDYWLSKWLAIPYTIYAILTKLLILLLSDDFPSWWFSLLFPLYGAICFIGTNLAKNYLKERCNTRLKWLIVKTLIITTLLLIIKASNTQWWSKEQGSIEGEKEEIIERRDYLISKVITTPAQVLKEMPSGIGLQFQGEWALYTCSMLSAALTNISTIYPDTKESNIQHIDSLIKIVISPELRKYDKDRWGEDPLMSLESDQSHISYLSHLAWMISGYKIAGGGNKYDKLFTSLCNTMNRRIRQSKCLNLATYPGEPIYMPDMLVAIVALSQYSRLNGGKYSSTVNLWVKRAKAEWIDKKTGLLVSFLQEDGAQIKNYPVKGSFSALNSSYLSYIDDEFARQQYDKLKNVFWKDGLISGFKEYGDGSFFFGLDIDAGPIVFELSPSGTAFAIGAATYFDDYNIRNKILRTAEIAGHTIEWNGKRHYALADVALVGEAIMLAMRTNYRNSNKIVKR